jgi:hypothetical protein
MEQESTLKNPAVWEACVDESGHLIMTRIKGGRCLSVTVYANGVAENKTTFPAGQAGFVRSAGIAAKRVLGIESERDLFQQDRREAIEAFRSIAAKRKVNVESLFDLFIERSAEILGKTSVRRALEQFAEHLYGVRSMASEEIESKLDELGVTCDTKSDAKVRPHES